MKKEEYSSDYPPDYFFSAENIPNQDLVFMTYDYFESGLRAGYLSPLDFLNLLEFNFKFLQLNVAKPFFVLEHLKSIPIEEELRHILFGFLLKWFGGYPVENMDEQYNTTLRLIEREFLKYPGDTPEKKICQKDWNEYQRMKQIEKFINHNINGEKVKEEPEESRDEWTENFEKSMDELHRREFKEIGGVRIEFTSFNQLLKDLEYNYPLYHAPLSYYHTWKEDIKYLKIEILDNLLLLPETAKIHYLDRLRYQIKEKQSAAHTSEQDYVDLLSKYNTNKKDIIEVIDYDNKIFKVVRSDVPSFHETMEPDFFADTINIQHIFYNYHFGEVLREAISFIDEQINTRTEKNKEETKTSETPQIIDNTKKDNLALDNLLESLQHKIPFDKGPFESLNIWDNNLRAFYREVLHTLSEKLPENKKHYLDLVRRDLEDKKKNIFVTDEQYDSLLADFNFDRESVLNTYDSEDTCIGALASKAIILDSGMPHGYNEQEQDIQQIFYNFHYGQTLKKALDFVQKQYEGIGLNKVNPNKLQKSSPVIYNSFEYKRWNSDSAKIAALMNYLKKNNFIDHDTELPLFRKLFENKPLDRKIIWKSNITNLSYFIKGTAKHPNIKETKQMHWDICVQCFELQNGKPLHNQNLRTQKNPANSTLLDNALKLL